MSTHQRTDEKISYLVESSSDLRSDGMSSEPVWFFEFRDLAVNSTVNSQLLADSPTLSRVRRKWVWIRFLEHGRQKTVRRNQDAIC